MKKILYIFSFIATLALLAVSCAKDGMSDTSGSGIGGSLARFTIAANHLYLADASDLHVYDLSNPENPVKKESIYVDWAVETIFPYGNQLFIGSRNGMYIYSIANPAKPVKLGQALHLRACDPVVAKDTFAYVTLQGGSACGSATDGLYIYNVSKVTEPKQLSLLEMSTPLGLGLKDSVLFICRRTNGLSVVNVKDPVKPQIMYTRTDAPEYRDVIRIENTLICYVNTGLLLYDVSNLNNIVKIGDMLY